MDNNIPQARFWDLYDRRTEDAFKTIIYISPEEIINFVKSMQAVYEIILKANAEAIFVPDRGAAPLVWSLMALDLIKGNLLPQFISLPIGSSYRIFTNKQRGFNFSEKSQIIKEEIEKLKQIGIDVVELKKIVLLDEAQSGSTSATAVKILQQLATNASIVYIACKDYRGATKKVRSADPLYQRMTSNEISGVEGNSISVPLFYVDRPAFLDILIEMNNLALGETNVTTPLLQKIHNTEAKKIFEMLVMLISYPRIAKLLSSQEEIKDFELSEIEQRIYEKLRDIKDKMISKAIEDAELDGLDSIGRQTRVNAVHSWFKRIADALNL